MGYEKKFDQTDHVVTVPDIGVADGADGAARETIETVSGDELFAPLGADASATRGPVPGAAPTKDTA